MIIKFCGKCGVKLRNMSAFCHKCGWKVLSLESLKTLKASSRDILSIEQEKNLQDEAHADLSGSPAVQEKIQEPTSSQEDSSFQERPTLGKKALKSDYDQKPSSRKGVIIGISIVLLFILLAGTGALLLLRDRGWLSGLRGPAVDERNLPAQTSTAAKIVFSSERDAETGVMDVFIMDADGSNVFNVTKSLDFDDRTPALSPDGQKIVFSRIHENRSDLYLVDVDGSNLTPITKDMDLFWSEKPRFCPSGSQIVFYSSQDRGIDNMIIHVDGSGLRNITNSPGTLDISPCFSPDGNQVVFASNRNGAYDVFLMNTDGSGIVNITMNADAFDLDPCFSPDGTQIVFTSDRDGGSNIFVMGKDGSGVKNLSAQTGDLCVDPCFSPDGSTIVFASYRDGNMDVFIMNMDGTGITNITNNPAHYDGYPSF